MNTKPPDIGLLLPTRGILFRKDGPPDASPILAMAEAAEEMGCASVWVGDSVTARPRLEPLTTLAAVAARTRRVRIGTAILLAALRHPVLLAHIVATLDIISEGRTVLAMGVGGATSEWSQVGLEPSRRAGRLAEAVTLMKEMWTQSSVSFQGRHFQIEDVSMELKPVQRSGVPVWFACHLQSQSEAQLRRAATLGDGYISIRESPQDYAQVTEKVRQYARQAGRDPDKLESSFYITVNMQPQEDKAREEGIAFLQQYYGAVRGLEGMVFGSPQAVVSRIREYAQAGAGHIIVRFASFDQGRQLETFRQEVLPAFR